jgi:SAM-dependent methyltransferase
MAFDSYQDIFNKRGKEYHDAMTLCPDARRQEFELIVEHAQLEIGQIVCDMPAGGGYLQHYIPDINIDLVLIEPSREFYDLIPKSDDYCAYLSELEKLPFNARSLDTITSLVGLHHADNKPQIFKEMHRLLKHGGRLCIADVGEGSSAGDFLNIFVDQHSSSGHQGIFIDNKFRRQLEMTDFNIVLDKTFSYFWKFSSKEEMARYCILLFGIDLISVSGVLNGIDKHMGYVESDGQCYLNWGLNFLTCIKL